MMSKIFTGHSFAGAVKYVVANEQRAEVLVAEGVRSYDWQKMRDDFLRQASLQPGKKKACFHAILSFSPNDTVDDKIMRDIAQNYLAGMGLSNTQFVVVKHTDKDHPHVHLIANLVDNEGRSIKDSWMGLKGKKIAQQLTKEYGLTPAIRKDLEQIHPEALGEAEKARYKIYEAIKTSLPFCDRLEDLAYRLERQDIKITVKYKSGSETERQGISFELGDFVFKGSKVDRMYSLTGLEKTLELNRKWKLTKQDALTPNYPSRNSSPFQINYVRTKGKPPVQWDAKAIKKEVTEWLNKVAGQLTQPEQGYDPMANEIISANRRKRKQKRSSL